MDEATMAAGLFKRARDLLGREAPAGPDTAKRKVTKRFHAVCVVAGARSCAEARSLKDHRFLSHEAPPLPLAGCGSSRCECHYEHFEDRRKGGRRAHDLSVSIDGYTGEDLRASGKRGRRSTDK
jgi:hypothetical protein